MRRAAKVGAEKYLGRLCKRGHDHESTGQSLRVRSDRSCVVCKRECALRCYHADPAKYAANSNQDKKRKYIAKWKRDHRAANPEQSKAYARARYVRENLKMRLRSRLRKAFVQFSLHGKVKPSCEFADFAAIIAHLGPCPGPLSEWQIDHIKPLASFDFNDPDQVRLAFLPSNHQWLTAADNRRKYAKES